MVKHAHGLRGLGVDGTRRAGPLLLQRTEQDVVPAVLDDLSTQAGRTRLAATEARERGGDGQLRLYQPVHRTFHLALVEAFCEELGEPRVDPRRVESAGLVVRRVRPDGGVEGWMRTENRVLGWKEITQLKRDPDPARRLPALRAGNAEVTRRLSEALAVEEVAETVSPLFVAPPDVCRAAGKTVLFGFVPVSSAETSEEPRAPIVYKEAEVRELLPPWVRDAGTHAWAQDHEYTTPATNGQLRFLETIGFFDAVDVMQALDQVTVRYGTPRVEHGRQVWDRTGPLGAELRAAADSLHASPQRATEPREWTLPAQTGAAVMAAARRLLEARMAAARPGVGRFDPRGDRFQVRAFVRLRRCDGCPPELEWSEPSEPFAIVPWYDAGVLPPVRVVLPDATPAALAKLKPSVSFVTPRSVADKMAGMGLKDLTEGKAPSGDGMELDWLCGFNIPIITLCAFIVLSLFLSLLNFVFRWLPFVKICIPIPRSLPREEV
jgi:hypothetical protein